MGQVVIAVIMLAQLLLVPALLIGWVGFGGIPSVAVWALRATAVGAAFWAMDRLMDWTFLTRYGRYAVWGWYAAALVISGLQARARPLWTELGRWGWVSAGAAAVLFIAAVVAVGQAGRGRRVPGDPVDLTFPLSGGRFHVAHGGSRPIVNGHMKVAAPELRAWRGQMWALDVVALYPAGNRAQGLFPENLSAYAIFGQPVYAPCDGEVVEVENELPDLTPPESDSENKAGNYVLLRREDGVAVLLAHLRQGSVVVAPGQRVEEGALLGEVGNSGNTTEPHLHVNAQRGVGEETVLDAEPLPATFNGRWLVRNDLVRR
jgi:hypothetical protein